VHLLGLAASGAEGSETGLVAGRAYELSEMIDDVAKELDPPMSAAEKKRLQRLRANV
jgi:hypothetical protein